MVLLQVRSAVHDLLESREFTQDELAAALNVSQASISNWLRGTRAPQPEHADRIARAIAADSAEGMTYDIGLRRGPIQLPRQLWQPVFVPRGRFRLPLHLEWSGSDEQRWRDAGNLEDVLMAYKVVMTEGRIVDMVRWIDPEVVAAHVNDIIWPRGYEAVWRDALRRWGLL